MSLLCILRPFPSTCSQIATKNLRRDKQISPTISCWNNVSRVKSPTITAAPMAAPIVNGLKMEGSANVPVLFDASILQREEKIPDVFVWPPEDRPSTYFDGSKGMEMEVPLPIIDLGGFWKDDEKATKEASEAIGKACLEHGFFQVINHQVSPDLITAAHQHINLFFGLPLVEKQRAKRKLGESCGYASSFTDRFASKLPWKETLSFDQSPSSDVSGYFVKVMGEDFLEAGNVYKEYCQAMERLALGLMELLGMSLGVGSLHFRKFFEGGDSILRLNYYPPCGQPNLTLGTGPHCDPTSLTLLHQDEVGGLEIFINNKWHSVQPNTDAFVVNIGDTFMALSNGKYKSCLHRAVVNKTTPRKSLAFFVNPPYDKIVRAPDNLLESDDMRKYPDFKWSLFLEFTQKHYRSDMNTLAAFQKWLISRHQP